MRAANYVEETTTSIAGTSGDGAVTLTAITGIPRFSTVFGTQATAFRYVIEDTINKKFETGIGSVSSNVLTRTSPQITWDGSTYDDSTPSPIAFGSSPTSGDIKIRMSAVAESQGATMPGFGKSSDFTGRDATWGDYPLSGHVTPWSNAGASTNAGTTLNFQYYRLDYAGLLSGVQVDCTGGVAGRSLIHGLYSIGANGLPNSRIVGFNDLDCSTTAVKTDTTTSTWTTSAPVWLTPGWYAYGFCMSNTGANLRMFTNSASNTFSVTPIGRTSTYAGWKGMLNTTENATTGPVPAVPSLAGAAANTSQQLWVGLKVIA